MQEEQVLTTIGTTYVKNWGIRESLREVLQNAIDAKSQYACDFSITYDEGLVVVSDDGPGLNLKHMALGLTDKTESQIGQFGEGLKLAMLVHARLGLRFELRTGDYILKPTVVVHPMLNTEVIAYEVVKGLAVCPGTIITLEASEKDLAWAKAQFVALTPMKAIESGVERWNSKAKWAICEPGGKVFCGGQLVKESASLFSYVLTGKDFNRDRTIIDEGTLHGKICSAFGAVTNKQIIMSLLKAVTDENSIGIGGTRILLEHRLPSWNIYLGDDNLWKEVAESIWGKKACLSSSITADNKARWMDYIVVRCGSMWSDLMQKLMPTASDVSGSGADSRPIEAREMPADAEAFISASIRQINKLVKKVGYRNVQLSRSIIRPVADLKMAGSSRAGAFTQVGGKPIIFLDIKVLRSLTQTRQTLMHETIHWATGADDCTPDFVRGYEQMLEAAME